MDFIPQEYYGEVDFNTKCIRCGFPNWDNQVSELTHLCFTCERKTLTKKEINNLYGYDKRFKYFLDEERFKRLTK